MLRHCATMHVLLVTMILLLIPILILVLPIKIILIRNVNTNGSVNQPKRPCVYWQKKLLSAPITSTITMTITMAIHHQQHYRHPNSQVLWWISTGMNCIQEWQHLNFIVNAKVRLILFSRFCVSFFFLLSIRVSNSFLFVY